MGRKKKKKLPDSFQLYLMEKGIYMSEEELEEAVKRMNDMLEKFPYPEMADVSSSDSPSKNKSRKD